MSLHPPVPRPVLAGRPYQWRPHEIELLAGWCSSWSEDLFQRLPGILQRVPDYTASGFPTSTDGERVKGGSQGRDGGPTARMVISNDREDWAVAHTHRLIEGFVKIALELDAMHASAGRLAVADPDDLSAVMEVKLPAGVGVCANPNCGRYCAGGPDRLKAGRCEQCDAYRRKYGRERDHELCHAVPVGGCDRCERTAA